MAQQTAVEWLYNELIEKEFLYIDDNPNHMIPINAIIQQAKAMEKEQILNACYQFSDYPFTKEDHLEYYKETYSK